MAMVFDLITNCFNEVDTLLFYSQDYTNNYRIKSILGFEDIPNIGFAWLESISKSNFKICSPVNFTDKIIFSHGIIENKSQIYLSNLV